jgi:DNA primase
MKVHSFRTAAPFMPAIKPTCVRDLKLRVNLGDVVSRVVTLRKAGGTRLKGLCPFHQEKTPSFHVDPDKGFYKCFGCGKAGDLISFVRETEQLGFTEAVEAIGQRFGIVIEYEEGSGGPSREERSLRQEIFEIHELATEHYHQAYKGGGPAGEFMRTYWAEKRRFTPGLAEEFKIGAAAPADDGLGALLLKRKFSEEALRQCGLFFIREGAVIGLGSLKPRFRGRLMIPIRDHQGRVVAFTARQTELTPADDPAREAKYVNSPETPIFTKGNLLFNLDRARSVVGKPSPYDDIVDSSQKAPWPFIIVEGQLDALRCWDVGLKTAVAPQGTSITENQLSLIRRYHTQIECLFDSDSAGQKAAMRFLPMALKAELGIRFLRLSNQSKIDPDLLFLDRKLEAYDELRKNSISGIEFACSYILPTPEKASGEQRSEAAHQVFEIIAAAEHHTMQRQLLGEAAKHLRFLPSDFTKDFERFIIRRRSQSNAIAVEPSGRTGKSVTPEHELLLLCLHFEAVGQPLSHALPHDWIDTGHTAGVLLNRFLGEFEHGNWPGRDHLDALLETPEEKSLVASLLFDTPNFDDPGKIAQEGLRLLRARALEPRLRQIELALANPGADSNSDPISLFKERSEIQRQLRQPVGFALPS